MDSECSPCSELGRQIQADGLLEDSIIEIGNLHDEHYRELVRKARPEVKMEPTLLHLDGDSVAVSTGMRLAADLVKILGWKRAYRVAALVRSATQDASFDQSRRSFLIKAAGVAAVLPFAPMLAKAPAPASSVVLSVVCIVIFI